MNWYKKSNDELYPEPPEWDFPEAEHDFRPSHYYDEDPTPDEILVNISEQVINEVNSKLIPDIGMGKAKAGYIKNDSCLARYVNGTAPHPVFVINLESIRAGARQYGLNIGQQIEATIIHELGHAIQDWMGLPSDEEQAEEFATEYYHNRTLWRFWE